MKRLLLILTSIFALVTTSWADQITRDQALAKAQQFLNQKGISRSLKVAETQMSRARARGKSTPDYYYVFNAGQNQGFVIISGEDATEEVLGYSTSGSFDLNNIPPAMEALLNYYSAQISMIQQGKAQAAPKRATHSAVSQLMTVKWGQSEPYNGKTPLGYYSNKKEGVNCVTGCVATAMAQVLYHQRFVNSTQAEIAGYKNHTSFVSPSGTKEANVPTIPQGSTLDWANMVDSYNGSESQEQKDAVANLMLYCGAAVQMDYGLKGSSASNSNIPDAFKKYFGYSRGTRHVDRSNYSNDDWDNLIYNEIASGRPVIYGGQTKSNSGHAFIVHGYDGAGKYAINWGWGGYQDNYFTLDNLTPDEQGTGGGKTGEGYNYDQEAVIYLAKEDGTFSETVKATAVGVNVDGVSVDSSGSLIMPSKTEYSADKNSWGGASFALAYKYTSTLANTYTMDCGYGILDTNGQLKGDVKLFKTGEIKSGYIRTYASGTTAFGADLGVGTYYIKPYSKESTASEWLLCEDADKYAILMNVTETKMSFKVVDLTSNPDPDPEVSDTQRDELKKKFENLKDKIIGKHEKVSANATEIEKLQSASATASEAVSGVDDKLAALKTLIDGSKLLTEAQKTAFTKKLDELKAKKETLDKFIAKLETIKTANDNLKQQLGDVLKVVNEQISGVSNITTTKALDEANAKFTELNGQIDGYNADEVETDVKEAKEDWALIDVNTISESLKAYDSDIAKAIADAKAEAEAKEEAEKLAKAKEDCNNAVKDLTKVIEDQTNKYNEIVKRLNNLKDNLDKIEKDIEGFQAKAKAISDMIAEMKSPSADRTRATADEIKKYEDALANLNTQIDKLSEAKAKVEQEIKNIEGLKEKTEKIIDDATKLRDQVKNGYADATSSADVEAMITQVTTETTNLNSDGAESINTVIADINTQIAAVEAEIAAINTDVPDVNKQTEDLNKEVTAGIGNISVDENDILGRYDLSGRPVDANYKGAMIIRMTNGKTITIFKR